MTSTNQKKKARDAEGENLDHRIEAHLLPTEEALTDLPEHVKKAYFDAAPYLSESIWVRELLLRLSQEKRNGIPEALEKELRNAPATRRTDLKILLNALGAR